MDTPNTPEEQTGDELIIARCDLSVRHRCRLELQVVRRTIRELKEAGFSLAADDGETESDELNWQATERQLIDTIFSVDEAHLYTRKAGSKSGFVFFVMGNDGYDVVNDYTVNLEHPAMANVSAYADKLEAEGR